MKLTIEKGSENYVATVVKIKEINPIEGADKIGLAYINGNPVIVSKDLNLNEPVVYFTALTELSDDLCKRGNLYTSPEMNEDTSKRGFIEKSRRVKIIKLRGEYSNGMVLPLSLFPNGLKEGDEFTTIDNVNFCKKYIVPTNIQSTSEPNSKQKKAKKQESRLIDGQFQFHIDTSHLAKNLHQIKPDTYIEVSEKLHGCLPANQSIKMWDGTTKPIKTIKVGDIVVGEDGNGKLIPSKVLNTFINGRTDTWIRFKKDNSNISRRASAREMFSCTPNHKIYVKDKGYIEADKVNITDEILTYESFYELTESEKNFLIGKYIGDGYLDISNKNYSISFGHKKAHESYIDEVFEKFPNLFTKTKYNRISGYGSEIVDVRTISGKHINMLFEPFLKENVNILHDDFSLNFEILSTLYIDDGSLAKSDKQKDRANIAICSFNDKDCEILKRELNKLGFNNYTIYKDTKGYNRLRFNLSDANYLFDNIKEFIQPTMQYKLSEQYRGFYNNDISKGNDSYIALYDFIKSKEYLTPKDLMNQAIKYDIETETHNFISGGLLVHNSSAIFANVLTKRELGIKDKIAKFFGVKVDEKVYDVIYSSRKVIKNSAKKLGYYNEDVWKAVKDEIYDKIPNGVTLYGEIVGYTKSGQAIQKKYDYGCKNNEHKFVVYRMTTTSPDGDVLEWSPIQIKEFCDKRGLLFSDYLIFYGKAKDLINYYDSRDFGDKFLQFCKDNYTEMDCDFCSNKVPREGVVVRVDSGVEYKAFKLKSQRFILGENKAQESGEKNMEDEN